MGDAMQQCIYCTICRQIINDYVYIFFISILMYNVFTHKRYKESVGMRRIEDSQTHNTYSKHLTTFMYRVNGQNTQSKTFNLI